MPLFNRRSRSVSISRPTTPSATNPALLAASQAFSTTQAGQKKLAQGAAATALRSMSPTSTPVSQVQTKRMVERQSSVGAPQSTQRGRGRGDNLVRRTSSSSMTERTFREPSPGRPSTSSGLPASRREEPPVPRLPETYANIPPVPTKSRRRSASIDEIQMRKSSATGQAQPRKSTTGSGEPRSTPADPASAAAKRVIGSPAAPGLTRTDSNNSVNFSYPGRARPISPPPQQNYPDSPRQEVRASAPGKSSAATKGISQTEARNIQRDLVQVSQQPVRKKKKRDTPLAEGSHLQAGTKAAKPKITPLEPGPPPADDTDEVIESDRGQNKARLTGESSHFPPSPSSPNDQSQASDSDSATERVRARRALRASGALQKQPSVVREDWEGEQEDVPSSPIEPVQRPKAASRKRQTPAANVARKIETSANVSRPEEEQRDTVATRQNLAAPEPRQPSLSPSRSTRFSNRLSSDMTAGLKHDPPPRSVSPRKPALKHSPSPQVLPVDSHRIRDSSLSPSEGTDVSFDGAPRRVKKSTHVKFDSQPAVVGIAAEPDPDLVADSIQVVSPQYREQPKKWYSMSKKTQGRSALSNDSDDDNAMKPRPQLPTFGSVRNARRNDGDASATQQVAPPSPSSSSSSSISSGTAPTTMDTSISSDHAIGGLLSREHDQTKRVATTSRQPQIRSTEADRPVTGADGVRGGRNDDALARKQPIPVLLQQRPDPLDPSQDSAELPSIAVQPATPGTEEELKHKDQWLVEVPGGFPSSHAGATQNVATVSIDANSHSVNNSEARNLRYEDEDQSGHADVMPAIQEESDRDSVYSDAAEDLSDLEGDGFGSIAAIVHSPVASPSTQRSEVDAYVRGAPQRNFQEDTDEQDDDWENAGARWKNLAEGAKRTSLQPSAPITERQSHALNQGEYDDDDEESPPTSLESSPSTPRQNQSYHAVSTVASQEVQQPSFRKSMRTSTPEVTASNTLRNSKRDEPKQFASKTLRGSMRNSAENESREDEAPRAIRSSMRDSGVPSRGDGSKTMRSSMRGNSAAAQDEGSKPMRSSMRESGAGTRGDGPKVAQPQAQTRSSSGAAAAALVAAKPASPPRATLQKKNLQTAPAPRKALPPVQDDSDSDSSFRKRRRAKASDTSRYSMRRSMRADASPTPANVDRRAVRSLSPVQRRPFSPSTDQLSMRTTMRGSNASNDAPTLRNQNPTQRSSSLFGRKKDARSPTRPMSLRIGSSSRVADSDDDRRNLPTVYKSRFSRDSDDEESDFRPVRGIPRKAKDDDSTDLEDSSDEEKSRKESTQKKLALTMPTSSKTATEEPASPTSPDSKKKRGFFGRLRKNKDETASPNNREEEPFVNGSELQLNGKQSANSAALGFSTDAEKEALIEETRRKLEAAKDEPAPATPEKPAQRIIPQRHKSDSWPLTPKDSPNDDRPYTADGEGPRPMLHRNSSSGTGPPSSPGGSSMGKTGKKKRFPLLRKAFGLKD